MTQKILFVCLGNICRSPTAEGALRQAAREAHRETDFYVDSAGTGDWHLGEAPDRRAQRAALRAGFDISGHRARLVCRDDFFRFDWILACDRSNLRNLERMCPPGATAKLEMALSFAGNKEGSIQDPYEGGEAQFDAVAKQCCSLARGILHSL